MRLGVRLFASMLVLVACSSSGSSTGPDSTGGDGGAGNDGGSTTNPTDGGGPGTPFVNVTHETMAFGGDTRAYILAVPTNYAATKKYPLVMVFHGSPGTADFMLQTYPFDPASGRDAIIVYPNAKGTDWDLYTATAQNADMPWIQPLIAEIAKKWSIDTARVLGAGWSGGAFFVTQLACRFSGLLRAIAVHAGGAPDEPNDPNPPKWPNGYIKCPGGPIATTVVHGQNDTVVDPGSGEFAAMYWAYVNQCGTTKSDVAPAPCQRYDGCPAATPVQWCSLPGRGHDLWTEGVAQSWGRSWTFFQSLP